MTNSETRLRQQLDALPREMQPERDLWQGIELALANEASPNELASQGAKSIGHSRPRWLAVAASVALVGVIGWMSLSLQPALKSEQLVAALSNEHEQQKNALLVKFQDQPALTDNWQQQIQELDEAAQAIKKALEHEPNNIALLKMLQNTYQQQLNLIERVHSPKWSQI
jgi:hypothetical protein